MAFPIPNMPTDSLYKFLALSGVALCIVVIVLAYNALTNARSRLDDLNAKVASQEVQSMLQSGDASFNKQASEKLSNIRKLEVSKNPPNIAQFVKELSAPAIGAGAATSWIASAAAGVGNPGGKELKDFAQSLALRPQVVSAQQHYNHILCLSILVFIVGGAIAGYGFWNWYFKHQIYIDTILRNAAEATNHESTSKT